jgi:hypothetical protein
MKLNALSLNDVISAAIAETIIISAIHHATVKWFSNEPLIENTNRLARPTSNAARKPIMRSTVIEAITSWLSAPARVMLTARRGQQRPVAGRNIAKIIEAQ